MTPYHKIQSIFKRDVRGKFITGEWSTPEIEYLQNNQWVWTEKVDGTNIRVLWDGINLDVRFGGKTDNASIPVPLFNRLTDLFPKEKFYGRPSLCLYGEGFGAKIQKGGENYKVDGVDFVLFDVNIDGWWLKRDAVDSLSSELEIQSVPIVGMGTISEAIKFTMSGFPSLWGNFIAEGLVLRPEVELFTRGGERIITKLKHKDFK